MPHYKTEVTVKGELTTVDVILEGTEIPLREINENEYYRSYSEFEVVEPLDVSVRLKGWTGMKWSVEIKLNDNVVLSKKGEFDVKGFVTFSEPCNV
jgi:hypothetical protein